MAIQRRLHRHRGWRRRRRRRGERLLLRQQYPLQHYVVGERKLCLERREFVVDHVKPFALARISSSHCHLFLSGRLLLAARLRIRTIAAFATHLAAVHHNSTVLPAVRPNVHTTRSTSSSFPSDASFTSTLLRRGAGRPDNLAFHPAYITRDAKLMLDFARLVAQPHGPFSKFRDDLVHTRLPLFHVQLFLSCRVQAVEG
jgi:hypothetical protein